MKKFVLSFILVVSQAMVLGQASAELSIITVDVSRLYEGYYKTKEATNKLQGRFDTAKAQLDEMMAAGDVEVKAYQTMLEQAQNPALSDSARKDAEDDANLQMEKIRSLQQDVQTFQKSTQNQLAQQQATQRQFMLEEIKTVILEIAQQRKADLVFDISTGINVGLPSVIFANPAWDSTDDVLGVLNADAPPPPAGN
ncbi:MAG: OmpH family outer membrane protein [Verrucomicrobia bacterium]|nr:OmpH family outer membrane protein [Verrucomicrobiota bacterium]MDA1065360.1 OmpH family outer membrane protein [Verrucomicrobiota bacterium]